MSLEPVTLVLLASEQLWPNLHSIEHWATGLERVLIYHTPDPRSADPARKLAQFCAERYPSLTVISASGAAAPDAVARQFARWRADFPKGGWVVNATGGTKLMFDGAAFLRGHDGVRIVYRELGPSSSWYELDRTPDGFPAVIPVGIPADVTDRVPVSTLVRTLWQTDALTVEFEPTSESLDVYRLTAALIETCGNWREAFAAAGAPTSETKSAGLFFERYVAAALLSLGLPQEGVARSVRQVGAGGQYTQEVDIVANHGSRVLVLDCKLRSVEEEGESVEGITSQLRQAAQTARRLGGLSGEVVLLRPNRELTGTERALATDLRVRVIDRTDRERLFRQLGAVLGVRELPDSLRRADELLAVPGNAVRAFPPVRGMRRMALAANRGPVIDLERLAGDWARDCTGQDWTVVRVLGPLHYLQYRNTGDRARRVLEDAVRELIGRFGTEPEITVSGSGDTLFALFDIEATNLGMFRDYLTRRVASPLLD